MAFWLLIQWILYNIHHCRYCHQSLAIKYTRKDTAFRTELSQGLSAISCVYYKTYTSFKGAKIQIYFYNKKLFSSFLSQRRFGMGAIENMGEFAMWAIRGKNARNSIGRFANRPYDTRKKPHANINVQWLMINNLCSLFILHSSFFTLHLLETYSISCLL